MSSRESLSRQSDGPWVHPDTELPVASRVRVISGRGGLGDWNGEVLDVLRVNRKTYTVDWQGISSFRVYRDEVELA